jgi:hypothetical protein
VAAREAVLESWRHNLLQVVAVLVPDGDADVLPVHTFLPFQSGCLDMRPVEVGRWRAKAGWDGEDPVLLQDKLRDLRGCALRITTNSIPRYNVLLPGPEANVLEGIYAPLLYSIVKALNASPVLSLAADGKLRGSEANDTGIFGDLHRDLCDVTFFP